MFPALNSQCTHIFVLLINDIKSKIASVYNGHQRGPVTLTPIADRLAVELSLHVPVYTTQVFRGWDSNTKPSACEANALVYCANAAGHKTINKLWNTTRDCRVIINSTVVVHHKKKRIVANLFSWYIHALRFSCMISVEYKFNDSLT